ncbi:protein piccolo isoform X4 [Bactrocera neohumeralis]|uniref:protein piccolo isoform X4 n=1 Tax=Bactrocera neohumeralis TaxID=98809 RepID=UPI0021655FBA|nr:protein piccolo isoform X4 [Bactrocera neohumeralis]
MATTMQQSAAPANAATNPQLKRIVYSKYRELLGSYNDKANAIIETLPAYMVREDRGFHCEPSSAVTATVTAAAPATVASKTIISIPARSTITTTITPPSQHITATIAGTAAPAAHTNGTAPPNCAAAALLRQVAAAAAAAAAAQGERVSELYGGSAQRGYEAPACVQNAMVTKDKKPFTYTPGGIDLSQIKSERMAKRLARNAQAEGATGASQQNRPTQPQSPGSGGNAASQIGAAGMGMPFQVLPPPPPPAPIGVAGKKLNGTSAPPPPPPPSSSNTLAPPQNGGGPGSAPGSPNAQRKSPTPQRFEPPPLGFRPEIKIPPNPMAALRKVPPPVEKNTFWKDEYVRDRSKSPMVGENDRASSPNTAANGHAVSAGCGEPATVSLNNNVNNNNNNDVNEHVDGYKKPTTTTQQPELNYNSNNSTQQQQYTPPQPTYSPSYQPLQQQQQQQPQYNNITPPLSVATPSQPQPQQQQQSPRPEFRSVAPPQSPSVHVYTRQTDSPRAESGTPPQRATDSPFRYGGPQPLQQQQQPPQQQRAPPAISPLAQQQPSKLYTSSPTGAGAPAQPTTANTSPNSQPAAQTVPWRTQRTPTQQQQPQSQPQTTAIYNNVSPQQQQQTQPASAYQGPKPSNVGSLYIAPLAAPTEPQAPNVVRQFQQQQQQQQARESPIRQIPQQQQTSQQQQAQPLRSTVPWLSTKPKANDQPEWARPEENGNVVPSSLNRIKSPPPPQSQQQQQQQVYYQQPQQQQPQPQLYGYQPEQGNGFAVAAPTNFGSHGIGSTGLRLQINANPIVNNAATQQTGPRERIIPIQLEQTPTNTTSQQPNFNVSYGGITTAPSSYVVRSPNQFVDQGYNNFPSSAGANQQPSAQRVMSPTQQLNAPRIVQQQQQYTNNNNGAGGGANRSRVIPIAMEGEGTRGPISPSPIVLQNDPRSSPIQSKSFRILQKITDTIDDGSGDDRKAESHVDVEPQLQRPQYARQMSAQQARQQPNVEQMRRMQIAAEPQQQQQQQQSQAPQAWNQGNAFKSSQQHTIYNNNNDMPQPYIHPSEQQVPEPKKYTGSAIPSRSFKILQAMTTPENAAELAATDRVELNETPLKAKENESKNISNKNCTEYVNEYNEGTSETTNTHSTTHAPSTTSSSSSISSLSSDSCNYPIPKHPYPAYGYAYPYPWYPPPMPPTNGEAYPAWPYPYSMPPPPPPPSTQVQTNEQSGDAASHTPYATHYPYYYPYYPPPPPPAHNPYAYMQTPRAQTPNEFDSQNAYHEINASAAYPAYVPPYPYPYPVAPSYSQSTTSSRASSVLPDIIVTPSTDDMPSQVILQHHIKIEKSEPPKRNDAVVIEEVATSDNEMRPPELRREQREGSVIDMLSQRLANMSKVVEHNLNMSKDVEKNYAGERDKDFGEKSPTDNASPVPVGIVTLASETEVSSDSESSSDEDSDVTPKCVETNGLQAIKSVTNIQIYKNGNININEVDDEDDVTTADGESDIFDEDDNEEDVAEELELDEYIEENDDMDYDNLSVIYEEESEIEHSSDKPNTIIQRDGSNASDATTVERDDAVEQQIEENDNNDDAEEDSTSVTVRLPLKFSFNDENVATVEVGKSQIEERRHSTSSEGKRSTAFVIAEPQNDSDNEAGGAYEYDDDCEVSVTISLSGSSRSSSMERKPDGRRVSAAYPIEELPTPEPPSAASSNENVSVSFSINARNKFMGQTIRDDVTNNIAMLKSVTHKETIQEKVKEEIKEPDISTKQIKEGPVMKEEPVAKESVTPVIPSDDLDFFATLRATKLQAQKMMETSANYWGKLKEKEEPKKEEVKEEVVVSTTTEPDPEVDDIWADRNEDLPKPVPKLKLADAKDDFWSTFAAATRKTHEEMQAEDVVVEKKSVNTDIKKDEAPAQVHAGRKVTFGDTVDIKNKVETVVESEEVDFWAEIEKSKETKTTEKKTKLKTENAYERKEISEVMHRSNTMKSSTKVLPTALQADLYTPPPSPQVEEESIESEDDDSEADEEEVQYEKGNVSRKLSQPKAPVEEKEDEEDFWASVEKAKAAIGTTKQYSTYDKVEVPSAQTVVEEIDFWADIEKNKNITATTNELSTLNNVEAPSVQAVVEEVDFWADIEKNKNITTTTNELSTPNNAEATSVQAVAEEVDFWADIEKNKNITTTTNELSTHNNVKSSPAQEIVEEVDFWAEIENNKNDRTTTKKVSAINNVETPSAQTVAEEVDFWANIKNNKEQIATTEPYSTTNNAVAPSTQAVVEESNYWANIENNTETTQTPQHIYDPTLYPEEPREVDTDEEIDFWAEIEAKDQDTDDVNFYKSASFWANRERHNSVDETPYSKVLTKPFPANLPDEPTVNVGLWAALEAAKGEEPEYIDPAVEEEKALAAQFNEIPVEEDAVDKAENFEDINKSSSDIWDVASLHEPVVANVWAPPVETNELSKPYQDLEQWIHNNDNNENTEPVAEERTKTERVEETDEANVKRNNYRKAMAFFTTSIDEQKEVNAEKKPRKGRSSNRNSLVGTENANVNEKESIENAVNNYYKETLEQSTARGKSVGLDSFCTENSLQQTINQTRCKSVGVEITRNTLNTDVDTEPYTTEVFTERNKTPTNFEQTLPEVYVEPIVERKLLPNGLPDLGLKKEEVKISVRDRISAFETGAVETPTTAKKTDDSKTHSLSVESCTPRGTLSRNSSQRSESEIEEDDSGVTDMNKPLSETDTESESFPELRKMSSYQRAATHSRLFKLLQDDNDPLEDEKLSKELADEYHFKPSRRKIVHNVSITRRQNPKALADAETMTQRRERLSLPLRKNTSIDADNPSTPNSPASPIMGQPSSNTSVSDKLVNELVQSLLLKRDSSHLRQMPMEKLQAAAKRVLEEELDSLENTSVETTPALTPNDIKNDKSYADYYDTWTHANGSVVDGMPPKAYRAMQDAQRRSPWSVRCPRVLSSKTINRDLARVTESPEIFARNSKSPDCLSQSREGSVSRWRKV